MQDRDSFSPCRRSATSVDRDPQAVPIEGTQDCGFTADRPSAGRLRRKWAYAVALVGALGRCASPQAQNGSPTYLAEVPPGETRDGGGTSRAGGSRSWVPSLQSSEPRPCGVVGRPMPSPACARPGEICFSTTLRSATVTTVRVTNAGCEEQTHELELRRDH